MLAEGGSYQIKSKKYQYNGTKKKAKVTLFSVTDAQ